MRAFGKRLNTRERTSGRPTLRCRFHGRITQYPDIDVGSSVANNHV
jgi:hypothetical protein